MNVRRLLVAAVLLIGTVVGFAPSASAGRLACAWVDPHGVCISNPVGSLPIP